MTREQLLEEGLALHHAGDIEGAARLYRRVLISHPRDPDALNLLGAAELQTGRAGQATRRIRQAIAERPEAGYYGNLGLALIALGQLDQARMAFAKAVELDADYIDGWRNLAELCSQLDEYEGAALAYGSLVRLSGGSDGEALGELGIALAVMCEWSEMALVRDALMAVPDWREAGGIPVSPFALLIHELPAAEIRHRAELKAAWIEARALPGHSRIAHQVRPRQTHLRVGYLSDDFREHPVAYLAVGMIEAHDRQRFEIYAYSYGPPDESSAARRRIEAATHFVDINGLGHAEAAARIAEDSIDILIDLKGDTVNARNEILALRPAPIQVSFLGYPGTVGAPYIDYILADRFVIPPELEGNYTEKVACLPGCFQPNDAKRPRALVPPSRAELGLPDDWVVFCSFNSGFKVSEAVFAQWLALLARHERSVLWMLEPHARAAANLREAALAAGIDRARLVFAPRLPQDQHLARLGAADLMLDTYPYNGHTTTSDALWCGLPVVTRAGTSFASRVAGSLLTELGFPELVAQDEAGYFAIADRLAGDPALLSGLRARIEAARAGASIFDPAGQARKVEKALDQMWERYAGGAQPVGFTLS